MRRQVHLEFEPDEFALLQQLGKRAGRTPTAEAKAIILDVLRDDAVAHGEKEKRNAVA